MNNLKYLQHGVVFVSASPMLVVLTFYRSLVSIALTISLFGCFLIWSYGSWHFIVLVFWTKVLTNTLLALYIHYFRSAQFYFFANLGYNKIRLLLFTFGFDMVIWFLLSWLIIQILL